MTRVPSPKPRRSPWTADPRVCQGLVILSRWDTCESSSCIVKLHPRLLSICLFQWLNMAGHEFQHYSLGSLGVDSNLSTLDSRNQPASIWLIGCCPILWLIVSTNGNNNKDGSLLHVYWVVTKRSIHNNDQHTTTIKVSGCGEQPSILWMVYCNTFHHMIYFLGWCQLAITCCH